MSVLSLTTLKDIHFGQIMYFRILVSSLLKSFLFTLQVAYWLQQHNVSVMMAACDTFRSGAVEQLRTHARRLKVCMSLCILLSLQKNLPEACFKTEVESCFQIPIFEKGYEKDPAIVAKEAIQEATRNHSDVVLVDTAGRMQVSFHPKLIPFLNSASIKSQSIQV